MGNRDSLFKVVVLVLFLFSLSYEVYGDRFLINCGSTENTSIGDRVFLDDSYMRNFLTTPIDILAKNPAGKKMGVYQTARVFKNKTAYKFPINQSGRYFIRFFFFPFTYDKYDMSTASFSVYVQRFELLRDFTPSRSPMVKEYSINATSTFLKIVLKPNWNSIAFLNALEVVLIPDALIQDDATSISPRGSYKGGLIMETFETSYRVNMGGPVVSSDSLGRTWISDDIFLENKSLAVDVRNTKAVRYANIDDAPPIVYGSCRRLNCNVDSDIRFNVTWNFDVDPGFQYLLRFHFCDIVSAVLDELYFNVYVNSWIVSSSLDLTSLSKGNLAVPVYLDYITPEAPSNKLCISIGPDTEEPNQRDGILNGLEIMKMSRSDTLSRTPLSQMGHSPSQKDFNKFGMILGPVAGLFFPFFSTIIVPIILYKGKNMKGQSQSGSSIPLSLAPGTSMGNTGTSGPSTLITHLSLAVIQEATNGFDGSLIIGDGGFGKVYKGVLGSNGLEVAVKRCIQGQSSSGQGRNEFENEIQLVPQLQHQHLISLVGYCDEQNELILVYRYMENESLKSHLYGKGKPILSWKKRLEICIGAAKGLKYLHHEKEIIHRDVKSGNILLDENFDAKLADFGLARPIPRTDHLDISNVKGTAGYIDPDYFMDKCVLSSKVDVYSFGVVLFEVLCARPVVDNSLPENERNLVQWAKLKQGANELELIIDNNLDQTTVNLESFRVYVETAQECFLRHNLRPSMEEVLIRLNRVLQAQLQADASNSTLVYEADSNTGATISDIEDIKSQTPSELLSQMRLRPMSQETGNSIKSSG